MKTKRKNVALFGAVFGMLMGCAGTMFVMLNKKKKKGPYKGKPGNKRRKLDEASYFFNCMVASVHKTGIFQFNYSAFLTAARSVLQYIHEEVNPECNPNAKRRALRWYLRAVRKSKVIQFGREERDENIHFTPVIPGNSVTVPLKGNVALGKVGDVTPQGSKSRTIAKEPEVMLPKPSPPAQASYSYTSSRWQGPEDLLTVGRTYLDELDALINDGVSKGYITW
jgi:hypothetical protein